MSERVTVSVEVLNRVLGVLSQRPYAEVANIITEVQQDVRPVAQGVDDNAEQMAAQAES